MCSALAPLPPLYSRALLQIFVRLTVAFKDHLKAEIEVFVCNVFLRILESENSTLEHKALVLEVIRRLVRTKEGGGRAQGQW